MDWEGVLFFVLLALLLLTEKYAAEELAEIIFKKYGKTLIRIYSRLSMKPVLRFIFTYPKDEMINKPDDKKNKSNKDEPPSPRVLVKPVADQSVDSKGENDNAKYIKPKRLEHIRSIKRGKLGCQQKPRRTRTSVSLTGQSAPDRLFLPKRPRGVAV
jgi:hypothetical protein